MTKNLVILTFIGQTTLGFLSIVAHFEVGSPHKSENLPFFDGPKLTPNHLKLSLKDRNDVHYFSD